MKLVLPERKLLVLILTFALVNPLNYALMALSPPENKVFLGYVDDAFQLALMKSASWDFRSPWDPETTIFENPVLGASYTFALLGTIPALLNLDLFLAFVAVKFLLSVLYLILIYNVIRHFLGADSRVKTAFIIFLFSSGVGWILYGATLALSGQQSASVIGYAFTNEFEELGGGAHALSHLTRIYWLLPEITGLLSLMLFISRKYLLSGILLAATILFYPTFSVAFALLIFVYFVSDNYKSGSFLANFLKQVGPVAGIAALGAVPWALNYMRSPSYFGQYNLWFSGLPLVTLLVTFALTFALAIYGFLKQDSLLHKKWFLAAFLFFGALSSVMHLYDFSAASVPLAGWLSAAGLYQIGKILTMNRFVVDLPFMLLFGALFLDVLRKPAEKNERFVLLWIVSVIAITVVSAQFVFWWPARMRWFLLLPLSVAAVAGIDRLSRKKLSGIALTPRKIVVAVILLSLPSLVGFSYYMQQVAHSSDLVYVSENDYAAMRFLRTAEAGRVLSSYQIGNNIPYFTGQQALLFNSDDRELLNRTKDYKLFFSLAATDGERLRILEEYNVTYVFYGDNEKKVSDAKLVLEGKPFLAKLFDDGTRVFRVA